MHGVELIRRIAADLHANAVVRGDDPWTPYAFATSEAKRRNIDVETIAPGAAQLNGGRATFISAEQLILHESNGSVFDQAFLVAHELGHVELGDDDHKDEDHQSVVEIDPARVSEASPIGIDRVVDYGRKQRREVQMDLFAREFLLPRVWVRKLHLEDGMSASQIAQKLGAPFEVVAQQLLDALLLPSVAVEEKRQSRELPLNDLQKIAADHRGVAYLLEAGPGTGKTQTLAARVEGLLLEGVDPKKILLLTFSNKAAAEMAERIARKHKDASAAMWIGTFHAFGLDIVRRFHSELGLPKDPRMMDRTEAAELLEREYPGLNLVHFRNIHDPTPQILDLLSAISRAKDEVIDATGYAALANAMMKEARTPEEKTRAEKAVEVGRVYAAYEKLKRDASCIDFGDLVSLPVWLLENNAEIRSHFQAMYEHVLVDEYQDVNRSSIRLLSALRGDGQNLWAVGDVKQSIYRFRGASSFNMPRFGKEDFPRGRRGRLKVNYRSVKEITDAFSNFAVRMKVGDALSGLEAERGSSGNVPELRTVDQAGHQSAALAETIEEMRRAGFSYKDQAVLCTGNEKLSEIGQDLERAGIPVLFLGSLFERAEIKDLLALLTLLTDRRAMGLIRIGCWSEFPMSISDVGIVTEHLQAAATPPLDWLHHQQLRSRLSASGQQSIQTLSLALEGFNHDAAPWDFLARFLLDRTRIAGKLAASSQVVDATRAMAVWQFMNFVRAQPPAQGLPITRLLDRVRRLLRLGDDRDLRQLPAAAQGLDAVRLTTIHGAKGLEFPVIHSPGVNANTIPRTPPTPFCLPPDGMIAGSSGDALENFKEGQAEEQQCLFFVDISRARDRLFFYAPTKTADGKNRPLSPFLDWLGPSLKRTNYRVRREIPPPAEAADIDLSVDGRLQFKAHQMALYELCPRRFFYTHVLQVGGRRTATMFMQMHEAVRSIVQSVVSGETVLADQASTEKKLSEEFLKQGISAHGYEADYKRLALAMLRYFLSTRANHAAETPAALHINFGAEQLVMLPDDVLVRPDGARVLRKIQTGHKRSSDGDDLAAAAFVLAARESFPNAVIELVHLADEAAMKVDLTARKLQSRKEKLSTALQDIRAGRFPADPSSRVCPGCPAFFICGSTPPGTLLKKF